MQMDPWEQFIRITFRGRLTEESWQEWALFFCQLEALLCPSYSEWLRFLAFLPDFPSLKHPFNSTLTLAVPHEQRFNAAGSGSVKRQEKEKSLPPSPILCWQ